MSGVLVVEDDPLMRKLILTYLDGIRTQTAASVTEAVVIAQRAPRPCVILADFRLGGDQTALDLISAIRTAPKTSRVPIVVLSAAEFEVEECYARGANSYLVKPASSSDFSALLREAVGYWCRRNTVGFG